MDEDDRRCVPSQNELDDLTRCHVRTIQSPAEELDEFDEMMARGEQQHAEDLVLQVRKTRYQKVFYGARRAEHRSACHTLTICYMGEQHRSERPDRQSGPVR